jgi:uncharacterized protein (DUF362 family)
MRAGDSHAGIDAHDSALARATVLEDFEAEGGTLLRRVLRQSGFWSKVEGARSLAGISAAQLRILILPDLEFFSPAAPTFTDPKLVESLIDLLHDAGYVDVAVANAPNQWAAWVENRDVLVLADLAGYRYSTPAGRTYEFFDLSEDPAEAPCAGSSILKSIPLSRRWLDAHVRINFAKNKTDEENAFALGLQNLLSITPLSGNALPQVSQRYAPEVAVALLRYAPPTFTLIDAIKSNHGPQGSRAAQPLLTGTIIASASVLLADWAASLRMQVDPFSSRLNAHALREIGLPAKYETDGPLAPYDGWINVPPLLLDSVRKRNASATFARLAQPWFQQVDPVLFPFKEMIHAHANAFATKYLGAQADDQGAILGAAAVNYLIAAMHFSADAMRTVFHKQALVRRETDVGFDPESFSLAQYEAVVPYMEGWEQIISHTPPDANGLRWRYIDGSIVFSASRVLRIPFQQWWRRVDISKAVQSMNDYIGGASFPVAHDKRRRVTHQAERNIYLPQPNWMAFFGGECIDVCKLEHIRYTPGRQRIYWRTIKSANKSAEFDDGIVQFSRSGRDNTEVSIVARQKFALPLFWQAINMDLFPAIKNVLVGQAYRNYFNGTIRNFEAQFEGREYRIGEPQPAVSNSAAVPSAMQTLMGLFGLNPADVEKLTAALRKSGEAANIRDGNVSADPSVDEYGFVHFPPGSGSAGAPETLSHILNESRGFLAGLAEAVRKDLGAWPKV